MRIPRPRASCPQDRTCNVSGARILKGRQEHSAPMGSHDPAGLNSSHRTLEDDGGMQLGSGEVRVLSLVANQNHGSQIRVSLVSPHHRAGLFVFFYRIQEIPLHFCRHSWRRAAAERLPSGGCFYCDSTLEVHAFTDSHFKIHLCGYEPRQLGSVAFGF